MCRLAAAFLQANVAAAVLQVVLVTAALDASKRLNSWYRLHSAPFASSVSSGMQLWASYRCQSAMYVCPNLSRFFAWSNCACALLTVQPGAWDCYVARATPCFARQNPGRTNSIGLGRVVRGPITLFRGGSSLKRSYSYSVTACRSLLTAQHLCV